MLADLQDLLLRAVLQPDPHAWLLAEIAGAPALSVEERRLLAEVAGDGLRLTRLLVRKLRIQRLIAGHAAMAGLCRDDPGAFAQRFAAYEAAVPPTAVFPSEEAALFRRHAGG